MFHLKDPTADKVFTILFGDTLGANIPAYKTGTSQLNKGKNRVWNWASDLGILISFAETIVELHNRVAKLEGSSPACSSSTSCPKAAKPKAVPKVAKKKR